MKHSSYEELQKYINEECAKAIKEQVDKSVLMTCLVGAGWHEVKVPPSQSDKNVWDMTIWARDNAIGEWYSADLGQRWIFENEEMALMFKLRWR